MPQIKHEAHFAVGIEDRPDEFCRQINIAADAADSKARVALLRLGALFPRTIFASLAPLSAIKVFANAKFRGYRQVSFVSLYGIRLHEWVFFVQAGRRSEMSARKCQYGQPLQEIVNAVLRKRYYAPLGYDGYDTDHNRLITQLINACNENPADIISRCALADIYEEKGYQNLVSIVRKDVDRLQAITSMLDCNEDEFRALVAQLTNKNTTEDNNDNVGFYSLRRSCIHTDINFSLLRAD